MYRRLRACDGVACSTGSPASWSRYQSTVFTSSGDVASMEAEWHRINFQPFITSLDSAMNRRCKSYIQYMLLKAVSKLDIK